MTTTSADEHEGAGPAGEDRQTAPAPAAAAGSPVMAVFLFALAAYLLHGTLTMEVPRTASFPGPQFFPSLVTAFVTVMAVLLTVEVLRAGRASRGTVESAPTQATPETDWRSVAWVLVALAVFVAALEPVGWLVSGAGLFWAVAAGLGSRRPLRDASIGLAMSSVIQLIFSAGLGLSLPPGVLAGI